MLIVYVALTLFGIWAAAVLAREGITFTLLSVAMVREAPGDGAGWRMLAVSLIAASAGVAMLAWIASALL